MGNEVNKNRAVSPCNENMLSSRINNYLPLRFHQVHGENVKLLNNRSVASRPEGFAKGIVFSDRPVNINEVVCVKFVGVSTQWSGSLRIGFSTNDPATMRNNLPNYACPDLTSIPGYWAKAIPDRMMQIDSVLKFYCDSQGCVRYGVDDIEHGLFFGGVEMTGKLWAVLDIYGNTVTIEFVDPQAAEPGLTSQIPLDIDINVQPKYPVHFHSMKGNNVIISESKNTAQRESIIYDSAYAFLERPLHLGEHIAIEILEIDPDIQGPFMYGITSCNPASLKPEDLPENADDLYDRGEYWIIQKDTNTYEKNDFISFRTHESGEVMYVKNFDADFNPHYFFIDNTQPLWVFFNIVGPISKIAIMGSSFLPPPMENLTNKLSAMSVASREEDRMSSECVVCYEQPVNCVFYRCGHMCMCHTCAMKMWDPINKASCPICRDKILDVIRTYK